MVLLEGAFFFFVTELQHLKKTQSSIRSYLVEKKKLVVSNIVWRQMGKHRRGPRERQLLPGGGESSPGEVRTGLQRTSFPRQWATRISSSSKFDHIG